MFLYVAYIQDVEENRLHVVTPTVTKSRKRSSTPFLSFERRMLGCGDGKKSDT